MGKQYPELIIAFDRKISKEEIEKKYSEKIYLKYAKRYANLIEKFNEKFK